jgi:hypothetical protein
VTPDREPPELIPRVVVKLAEGIGLPLGDGELADIEAIGSLLGPFALTPVFTQLAQLLEDAEFRRVFDAVPAADFQAMIDEAMQNDPDYDPPDLLLFLEVDVPDGVDAETLAGLLAAWTPVVEDAYVSAVRFDPVVGATNPLFAKQGFLLPSSGVDAPAAWAVGADGSGLRFIDIEQGWFLGHEDQPNLIRVLAGINVPTSHGHGTAVLGTVIGQDNNLGGVGIAPGAQVDVMSWASPGEQPGRRNGTRSQREFRPRRRSSRGATSSCSRCSSAGLQVARAGAGRDPVGCLRSDPACGCERHRGRRAGRERGR